MNTATPKESFAKLEEEFLAFESSMSTLSHDGRNRVGAIYGFAKLMKNGIAGPVTESQSHFLDIILRNCDQLVYLIARFAEQPTENSQYVGKHKQL